MSNEKQKPLFASGLYIALALCILAVVCVGAFSAINQLFATEPNPAPQSETPKEPDATDTPLPEGSSNPPQSSTPSQSENELVPQPDPAAEPPAQEDTAATAAPAPRSYTMPALGTISKGYLVDSLAYSVTMNDYRAHRGIDIAADLGAPVVAFTDGTIESVHVDPLMGQTVVVNHGDGLKSIYQNLSETLPEEVVVGAAVSTGALLGAVGQTTLIECAESPHLHFELHQDGVCVSPENYLTLE